MAQPKVMIDIAGKEYPLYRTMYAMDKVQNAEGVQEAAGKGDIKSLCQMAFWMVEGACLREGIDFPFTFEEFFLKVDTDLVEKLAEISPVPAKK